MKISVLIVAHNEEKWIEPCIKSILNQTVKPAEVVLLAHNCTDKTVEIAKKFGSVNIVEYAGPAGIVHARIKGIESINNEIICCIDGDSFAKRNWVEEMSKSLKGNIFVGSWVKFKGTTFGWLNNIINKYYCTRSKKPERWVWGPSMAFWSKDKDLIKNILEKSIVLSKELDLTRNPEDYWLALFLKDHGNIKITNKTSVTVNTKETSNKEMMLRNKENHLNGDKMENYFKNRN